jgi:hypothetical protein
MSELLRIVLETGLFFILCTVIFLIGFVIDARAQARRAAGARAEAAGAGDSENLERAPAAAA